MQTINEEDAGNYKIIIDKEPVNLTLLISRHKERRREIEFNLLVMRKSNELDKIHSKERY